MMIGKDFIFNEFDNETNSYCLNKNGNLNKVVTKLRNQENEIFIVLVMKIKNFYNII